SSLSIIGVDGFTTITGSNTAPVASNDTAVPVTERAAVNDPALFVPGPGILGGVAPVPAGDPLAANLVVGPAHGRVVVDGLQILGYTSPTAGDTIQLLFANFTTSPITYSTTPSTLASNIQTALNAVPVTGFGTAT